MHWVAPTEKDKGTATLEKRLWNAADQFRANSGFEALEYSGPILGIIFLRFDFVLANPPFNVNAVDTAMRASARSLPEGTPQDLPARQDHERLKDMVGSNRRFAFGLPRTDNANYLWIQLFHSALNAKGRAGFVMVNSVSDRQILAAASYKVAFASAPVFWFVCVRSASNAPCCN